MNVTADEVLQHRKVYKRAKQQYNAVMKAAAEQPAPAKKQKRVRAARARTEKEKANDARLKAQCELAKKIRADDPNIAWTQAVKLAAQQMKAK